jgi:outer membrane protein assembly factor BamB
VLQVIKVIETTLSGRGDLGFDGEKLWKTGNTGTLYALDKESGSIIRSYVTASGTGVTFFKDQVYLCSGGGQNILYVIDPLSGDILNRISTTGIYPGFLAAYGDRLIIYDVRSAGIFEYDPETGDAARRFELSGMNIGGIGIYKDTLLISDTNTDTIYRFTMIGEVTDAFTSPAAGIGGLTVDNSDYVYLFTLDGKIHKVSLP